MKTGPEQNDKKVKEFSLKRLKQSARRLSDMLKIERFPTPVIAREIELLFGYWVMYDPKSAADVFGRIITRFSRYEVESYRKGGALEDPAKNN